MEEIAAADATIVKWNATGVSPGAVARDVAGPLTFVLSTDDVDRHGDVVSADGWRLEAYLRNPVLLWAHDYRHPAIGRAVSVWTEPHRLLAKMEFAPTAFAQEVASLYACGFQWGVSVGFRPIRWEERRDSRTGAYLGLHYLEQELLEVSAVPVPANRQALRRQAEMDAGPETAHTVIPSHSVIPAKAGIHWQTVALGGAAGGVGGGTCLNCDLFDAGISLICVDDDSKETLGQVNPEITGITVRTST